MFSIKKLEGSISMKLINKNLIVVIFIIIILVAVSGCISTSNKTSNNTTNITEKNSTINDNTTTYINASKAKELAIQYSYFGVNYGLPKLTLGKPIFTTFNGDKVWTVDVSNSKTHETLYTIYINATTGERI